MRARHLGKVYTRSLATKSCRGPPSQHARSCVALAHQINVAVSENTNNKRPENRFGCNRYREATPTPISCSIFIYEDWYIIYTLTGIPARRRRGHIRLERRVRSRPRPPRRIPAIHRESGQTRYALVSIKRQYPPVQLLAAKLYPTRVMHMSNRRPRESCRT